MSDKIVVIGTGLVGRAWAAVFARAGFTVALYDAVPEAMAAAVFTITEGLPDLAEQDLLNGETPDDVAKRLFPAATLEEALDGAVHVQENVSERVAVKKAVYAQLDALARPEVVLASSTSGIPASDFTEDLAGRSRCLVAHPVNPPHIVPLVEIVPAPWTDPEVTERTRILMTRVGQVPIQLKREVAGFIVNRLQGALLAEAFRLVEDGVIDIEGIDAAIADGLGLRWSFIGPFETIDLNAPEGVRGYCEMLGPLYHQLAKEQADPREWSEELIAEIDRQRRDLLSLEDHAERQAWRDRRLAMLVSHKRRAPKS